MPADQPLESIPALSEYASHVQARLSRPRELVVETSLARKSPHEWFLARSEASQRALDQAARLLEPRAFPTPWQVNAAQMHCQKPFHLWNVSREEWKSGIAFERGLRYTLGQAAHEHGPTSEGRPGTVEPATALARRGDRERDEAHDGAWGHRKGLFALLARDPRATGLGRRDGD